MVITIDVGNTNITVGVFRGDEVMATFRITTKMPRTSDEYGMLLSNLLEQNKIRHDDIEDAIIASVVPNVMHSLEGAIIKYFGINPIIVDPDLKRELSDMLSIQLSDKRKACFVDDHLRNRWKSARPQKEKIRSQYTFYEYLKG